MNDGMKDGMRLTRRASMLLPLALGGCGALDWLGDEAKKPIVGKREPILAATRGLTIDSPEGVSVPPPVRNTEWLQPGGTPAHSGGNFAGGLTKVWTRSIGAGGDYRTRVTAVPLVLGNRVFTMDTDGVVCAFDIGHGSRIWRTVTKAKKAHSSNVGGGISIDGGIIYAATGRAEVMAIDCSSGKILWRAPMPSPARSAPTIVNGSLFVCTIDEKIDRPIPRRTGTRSGCTRRRRPISARWRRLRPPMRTGMWWWGSSRATSCAAGRSRARWCGPTTWAR